MDQQRVLDLLREHVMQFQGIGVRSLAVFGSVARGDARPDSDLDVVVDFAGPPTFDQYMELKILLEDLAGRRVDLVTRKALRPEIRSAIEAEEVRVA